METTDGSEWFGESTLADKYLLAVCMLFLVSHVPSTIVIRCSLSLFCYVNNLTLWSMHTHISKKEKNLSFISIIEAASTIEFLHVYS